MGFRRTAGTLILCVAVASALAGFAPDVAERYVPSSGPYARQIRTYLPAALLVYHPDPGQPPGAALTAQAPVASSAAPTQRPPVQVVVGRAEKKDFPWIINQIGTVQPIATVALRPHFDAVVQSVLVADGAAVKAGDILIKMDSRQPEAALKGAEAQLAKDQAQLEQAKRDVARYTDLVSRSATPVLNLDNARTAVASSEAAILGDRAAIDNLQVQLDFATITAPISGRIGAVNIKEGNIAKASDNSAAGIFATINQISPIYVAFSVSQIYLAPLREAMAAGAPVIATPQGSTKQVAGKLALIENAIDSGSGAILARAKFENADETLWPGQLCNLQLTLRVDPDTIVVPREAVQNGQAGTYVFVIADGVARVRPVTVSRTQGSMTVVTKGLDGNETLVIDGALMLTDGSKIEARDAQKGAS
jgi:multidrug efflux system membrane fusion protein